MTNLPDSLLDVLRCPITRSELDQDGSVLRSSASGPDGRPLSYRLDEGIPVLLRAESLDDVHT